MTYKLLTPGPLTTTTSVKETMLQDRCTWDDEYKALTQSIRQNLLEVALVSSDTYTAVLMQGSGSFTVESVLTTAVGAEDHILFITNGAYGERMTQIAQTIDLNYTVYAVPYNEVPTKEQVTQLLQQNDHITHVAMVHCETTTGILNPIEEMGSVVAAFNKVFIVDAMSSFGGVPIDFEKCHIDYLVSSANKCIEGVPGFGFVIAKRAVLQQTAHQARSVALDLYDQWRVMEIDGKWRFTSPTHVVAAFAQALQELQQEGGVEARYQRYKENNALLRKEMARYHFHPYIEPTYQSPIITTFLFPHAHFDFQAFYHEMKANGFVLYPGKLTEVDTFRVGNIGDVHKEDMQRLMLSVKKYMEVVQ